MMVKALPRMVRYLKERGTYVLFNTNGTLLTERKGRELIAAVSTSCACRSTPPSLRPFSRCAARTCSQDRSQRAGLQPRCSVRRM